MYSALVEQQQKQIQKLQKRVADISSLQVQSLKRAEKAENTLR